MNVDTTIGKGLYDASNEHDACGVGLVANIDGSPAHQIVENGMEVLRRLMHRGAVGGDNQTGDGDISFVKPAVIRDPDTSVVAAAEDFAKVIALPSPAGANAYPSIIKKSGGKGDSGTEYQ